MDYVRELSSVVPDDVIDKFVAVCHSANFEDLVAYVDDIMREGFGVYQLMRQLFTLLIKCDELLDTHKAVIFEKMAVSLFYILPWLLTFLPCVSPTAYFGR